MTIRDTTLDNGLVAMTSQADTVFLCPSDPTAWADANSNAVAKKTGSRGAMFYAISSPIGGGRMASLASFSDGSVTGNGNANYVAIGDSVTQTLFLTELLSQPQVVQSGGVFGVTSLQLILGATTQPIPAGLTVNSPTIPLAAFARNDPYAVSIVVGSPVVTSPILLTSVSGWTNSPIVPALTGSFTCAFDVVPNAIGIDDMTALSANPATTYTDCACIVLFSLGNVIQVRNGGGYGADATVNYAAGTSYHIRMVGNVATHTYSVWVTPQGSGEVQLAANYAFRTDQNTVTQLANFAINITDIAGITVSNLTFNSLVASPLTVGSPTIPGINLNNKAGLVSSNLTTGSPILPNPSVSMAGTITHGQQININNVGRLGAAAGGIANYSPTLTTVSGNQTYNTTQTIRNVNFTGLIFVTGGTVTFEFCRFTGYPSSSTTGAAVQCYNNGALCNVVLNWCDFDSGLRGVAGNYESCGLQLGERNLPVTIGYLATIYRCSVQGYGNGIGIHSWCSSSMPDVTRATLVGTLIQECYITNMTVGGTPPNHADGIEVYASDGIIIQRCRIIDSSDGTVNGTNTGQHQSCVNLTPAWTYAPNLGTAAGIGVYVDSCYMDGGNAPITSESYSGLYNRNARWTNNYFGDLTYWGAETSFGNSITSPSTLTNVTFNLAYAQANPTVVYWEQTNVWAPNGEGVFNPATYAQGGGAPQGEPHNPGAFVAAVNFGGGDHNWNGQVLGPSGPPILTANNLTASSPVLAQPTLNNKAGVQTGGLTTSRPSMPLALFSIVGGTGQPSVNPATINFGVPAENDQPVGTATASNSPTSWAITGGNPGNVFAISPTGVITANPLATLGGKKHASWSNFVKAQTYALTVQATNAQGSGTGIITVVCARLTWPALANRPSVSGSTLTYTGPPGGTSGPSTVNDTQQSVTLATNSATQTTQNGQVLDGQDFTGGTFTIMHNDVTLRRCRVRGTLWSTYGVAENGSGGTRPLNEVIEDCDLAGGVDAYQFGFVSHLTLRRCRIHGTENCLTKFFYDVVAKDCLIDSPVGAAGAHLDLWELYAQGGSGGVWDTTNITICNNTFTGPNTPAGAWCGMTNPTNWGSINGGNVGPDIYIDANRFWVTDASVPMSDDSGQGSGFVRLYFTNNGIYPSGTTPRRDGPTGATILVNTGNFYMATTAAYSGSLINGSGAI